MRKFKMMIRYSIYIREKKIDKNFLVNREGKGKKIFKIYKLKKINKSPLNIITRDNQQSREWWKKILACRVRRAKEKTDFFRLSDACPKCGLLSRSCF